MSRELTDAEVKVLTELSYKKSIKKENKMNKELEALKEARKFRHEKDEHLVVIDIDYFNRCLDGIETTLKAYDWVLSDIHEILTDYSNGEYRSAEDALEDIREASSHSNNI